MELQRIETKHFMEIAMSSERVIGIGSGKTINVFKFNQGVHNVSDQTI